MHTESHKTRGAGQSVPFSRRESGKLKKKSKGLRAEDTLFLFIFFFGPAWAGETGRSYRDEGTLTTKNKLPGDSKHIDCDLIRFSSAHTSRSHPTTRHFLASPENSPKATSAIGGDRENSPLFVCSTTPLLFNFLRASFAPPKAGVYRCFQPTNICPAIYIVAKESLPDKHTYLRFVPKGKHSPTTYIEK